MASEIERLRAVLERANTGDRSDLVHALWPALLAVAEAARALRAVLALLPEPSDE